MKNYLARIKELKEKFPLIEREKFYGALSGTHYKVFLSDNYVVRFRDDKPQLLSRETNFLRKLNNPLIPKVLWKGKIGESLVMVEERLRGETLDLVWKNLAQTDKVTIIEQVIKFLQYLKTQTGEKIYSVEKGKAYKTFFDYLTFNLKQKVLKIKKNPEAQNLLENLLLIINDPKAKELFSVKTKVSLVQGDLITHNLLTDGKNLTGVLDWELALWGDTDYDLCRLFYYQECARAYDEQGLDETFEADYMDKLITEILKSNLIKNKKTFYKKYDFIRAIFYLNALDWATGSSQPKKNTEELVSQWNKKG